MQISITMKIEEVLKTTALSLNKKTLLHILYTQNRVAESFDALLKQYRLSSEQFSVLVLLKNLNGKPANMYVIQEAMVAKTSNTTRLVAKLLQKGLATRGVCDKNRRKVEVFITAKGLRLLQDIEPAVNLHEEKFASNLTPSELQDLNRLLEKYRTV